MKTSTLVRARFSNPSDRRRVGVATWVFGLVLTLAWTRYSLGGVSGVGYGSAPTVEVAPLETARILQIPVSLHDRVSAGDVVARMDPGALGAERDAAVAHLLAAEHELELAASITGRHLEEGLESSRMERARLQVGVSADDAALAALRERLTVEQQLAATGASSSQAVAEWVRQIRVLEARVEANRAAVGVASLATAGAQARLSGAPEANRWTVVAASSELARIEARLAGYELRAGVDGEVSSVYRTVGEVLTAGTPLLEVRPVATREVVVFVAAPDASGLGAGDVATIRRASGQVIAGKLVSVGSGPVPLPPRLWKTPSWPEYGVSVRVRAEEDLGPDEDLTVHL